MKSDYIWFCSGTPFYDNLSSLEIISYLTIYRSKKIKNNQKLEWKLNWTYPINKHNLAFAQNNDEYNSSKMLITDIQNELYHDHKMIVDKLFIKEAFVGKSLRMKRWRPRAKGRAASIIKPFSKVTIVVEERTKTKKEIK